MNTGFNPKGYSQAIEKELTIINKQKQEVDFVPNKAQEHLMKVMENNFNIVVLKARKMGFSSVILAIAVLKFILGKNERCVSMSFDSTASGKQLERAKHFLRAFESQNGIKIPLKYNTKKELVYEGVDSVTGKPFVNTLRIGTARNASFGRGDDITFLHLTEVSFCPSMDDLISGVGEACVEGAHKIFETTANGFNDFKDFWDKAEAGQNSYEALFFNALWEYSEEFLAKKKTDLGERLFAQEYPLTAEEAFLTSGECYFDRKVLSDLLKLTQQPIICEFL